MATIFPITINKGAKLVNKSRQGFVPFAYPDRYPKQALFAFLPILSDIALCFKYLTVTDNEKLSLFQKRPRPSPSVSITTTFLSSLPQR
jgi:hypothetical protein